MIPAVVLVMPRIQGSKKIPTWVNALDACVVRSTAPRKALAVPSSILQEQAARSATCWSSSDPARENAAIPGQGPRCSAEMRDSVVLKTQEGAGDSREDGAADHAQRGWAGRLDLSTNFEPHRGEREVHVPDESEQASDQR